MPMTEADMKLHLASVQRNYDNVAAALQNERLSLQKVELQLETERREAQRTGDLLKEALTRADTAEGAVRGLQAELQSLTGLQAELKQLRFERTLVEEKNKVLSERAASADTQLRELRGAKSSAERMAVAAERREAKLAQAKAKLDDQLDELMKEKGSMESELRACRDTISRLEKEMKTMDRELKSAQRNAGADTQKQNQLQRDLEDARMANRSMHVTVESAKGQQRLLESQLQNTTTKLQLEIATLNDLLSKDRAKLANKHEANVTLQMQLDALTKENNQIADEVSQWKARYEELLARSEEEGGALAQITQECRSTRSELVMVTSEYDDYKQRTTKELKEASEKIEYLTKKLRVGDQLLGKAKMEQEELVQQLNLRIEEGETAIEKVKTQLQISEEDYSKKLDRVVSDFSKQATLLHNKIQSCHTRALETEHSGVKTQEAFDRLLKEATTSLAEERDARAAAERALEQLQSDVENMKGTHESELRAESQRASRRVQEAKEALRAMQSRAESESKAAASLHEQQTQVMTAKIAQLNQEIQGLRASTRMLEMEQQRLEQEKQVAIKALEAELASASGLYEKERAAAAERAEQERQRLEQEARDAKRALEDQLSEASGLYESERERARERLKHEQEASAKQLALNQQLVAEEAEEKSRLMQQLAQKESLASLLKTERELAAKRLAEQMDVNASLQEECTNRGSRICSAHEVCICLAGDIKVVESYVNKMVVKGGVKTSDREAPELLYSNKDSEDPGTGQVLMLSVKELRTHFAYLTEKVQDLVSNYKPPQEQGSKDEDQINMERELQATVSKLLHAEEAMESSYTCMTCMNVYSSPVTCVPCGHTFCRMCLETESRLRDSSGHVCSECGECDTTVENDILETLCSKYEYKLGMIRNMNSLLGGVNSS